MAPPSPCSALRRAAPVPARPARLPAGLLVGALIPGLLALGACGSGSDGGGAAGADAGASSGDGGGGDPDCWPAPTGEGGEVEVGTPDPFEPLEDDGSITLVIGAQGGVHIDAQSRVRGLMPGNPHDPFDPLNPYTLFSVHDEQEQSLSSIVCAFRTPYDTEVAEGEPRLLTSSVVLFLDPAHVSPSDAADRIGTRLRVGVEVIDAEGRHAADAHWVTVTEVVEGPAPH